jgi:hypothetical protein
VRIVNADIVIEQKTIDLGLPFSKFKRECERFTSNLFAELIDRFSNVDKTSLVGN